MAAQAATPPAALRAERHAPATADGGTVPPGGYTVHGLLDTNQSAELRTAPRTLLVGAAVP